jgi:ABC-type phosphate transport system substrate-binding protein
VTSVTSSPALPNGSAGAVQAVINGAKSKLVGDWPPPPPSSYAVSVHCSNATTLSAAVTVNASPGENDAVGVGSDTIQNVFDQFSADFNAKLSTTASHLYSWDATNPNTGAIGDTIREKADCSTIARPDGSSAGINQLKTFTASTSGPLCTNFARSSRPRASTDPPYAAGGVAFVNMAGDAVTWSAQATTNAPASLTQAQLAGIYNCVITNWSQVGGANAPIHAFIPQTGSGTRAFFLSAIGVANPGACVSDDGGLLEENEGVNPVLNDPNAIFPYSIGKYIAERFHSATCSNSACTPTNGIACHPAGTQNLFGCNTHGTMVLKEISGIAPTTGTGKKTVINSSFPATFQRTLFEVVPWDPATVDHIPGATKPVGGVNLEPIFGASGFICKNTVAKTDLRNYGFLAIATCGITS